MHFIFNYTTSACAEGAEVAEGTEVAEGAEVNSFYIGAFSPRGFRSFCIL
jgi:hypothetical protein